MKKTMDTEHIFDKSIWPLFTKGLHWALSDSLKNIGTLTRKEDDAVEYRIDVGDLPDGENGLWHFNALRDIELDFDEWPTRLRDYIESATLCIGNQALQSVKIDNNKIKFSMFSGESILPIFVVDDDDLTVRIQFNRNIVDTYDLPSTFIEGTGLLVRIKERRKAFFVAACAQSTLTWDGYQNRIFTKASNEILSRPLESSKTDKSLFDMRRRVDSSVLDNENSTFDDILTSLKSTPPCKYNVTSPVSWAPLNNLGPKLGPSLLSESPVRIGSVEIQERMSTGSSATEETTPR